MSAKKEKKVFISEKDECYFRQGVLVVMNLIWLFMEYAILDWDPPIKFRIIRATYFFFLTVGRIEFSNDPEGDLLNPGNGDGLLFTYNAWMTTKYFIADLIAMTFLVWTFGCSFM
jgi:hypothetical protein